MNALAQGLSAGLAGGLQGFRMAEQDNAAKVDRERRMAREDTNEAFQAKARGRQDADWAKADQIKAANEAANDAARQEYESLMNPPSLANGSLPGPPEEGGLSAPAPQPSVPREQAVVRALKARTGHLLKTLGPTQEWASAWKQEAEARDTLRGQSMDAAYAQYKQTGDPSALLKGTYPWVDDGWDLQGAATEQGKDGKPVVRAVRVNRQTGETEEKVLTVPELVKSFDYLRDPANARKIEVQALHEANKAERDQANKIEVERVKAGFTSDEKRNDREFQAGQNDQNRATTLEAARLRRSGEGGDGDGGPKSKDYRAREAELKRITQTRDDLRHRYDTAIKAYQASAGALDVSPEGKAEKQASLSELKAIRAEMARQVPMLDKQADELSRELRRLGGVADSRPKLDSFAAPEGLSAGGKPAAKPTARDFYRTN